MATHARRVLQTLMQPLLPHKRCMLEEIVETSLLRSTAGVHVLADPPSMYPGTVSVVVRSIIRRMQHQLKVAGALDLTFDEETMLEPHYQTSTFTFPALARQRLGLQHDTRRLSDMLDLVDKQDYNHDRERSKGKPVVVLIDNYDHAHRALGWKKSHAQLVALAEESALTKRFVVLVIVADPALRREILMWNDGQKIYPCN